jgi:hypothetical protein
MLAAAFTVHCLLRPFASFVGEVGGGGEVEAGVVLVLVCGWCVVCG